MEEALEGYPQVEWEQTRTILPLKVHPHWEKMEPDTNMTVVAQEQEAAEPQEAQEDQETREI